MIVQNFYPVQTEIKIPLIDNWPSNDKRALETNIELELHWPKNYFRTVTNQISDGFGAAIYATGSNGCCWSYY